MRKIARYEKRKQAKPFSPNLESLECRLAPSVTIQFDYSYDSNGFFNDPLRKQVLQAAANYITSRLTDTLLGISPNANNTWTATFTNPGNGNAANTINLTVPLNTIYIYVGAYALGGFAVSGGSGGSTAVSGDQNWQNTVQARGQSGALGPPASQT
ncbi:MAG TPA: hypothetical protein VGX70_11015, partial [Gemmataceae bacterium]|nr:hypothetical protein [Gemmataceae bacterium]